MRSGAQGACLVVVAALAAGACGDDDGSTAKQQPTLSAASEPPRTFIARMAKLLETTRAAEDCTQLQEINNRSFTRFTCPPAKRLSESMATFEVVRAGEYGTGAVVDYRSGEADDGAAIVLFVAPDRNWGVGRFGLVTEPSVGTSDKASRTDFDRAVDDYLAAVRERDCKAFQKAAYIDGKQGGQVCETTFAGTAALAKRLEANPAARARYEGGNRTYGFYTLETAKPREENSTISVIRAGAGATAQYVILDVAPSPTTTDQLRARRQL